MTVSLEIRRFVFLYKFIEVSEEPDASLFTLEETWEISGFTELWYVCTYETTRHHITKHNYLVKVSV